MFMAKITIPYPAIFAACLLLLAWSAAARSADNNQAPVFDQAYLAEMQSENIALRGRIQRFPADIQQLNREVSAAFRSGDHAQAQALAGEMDRRYPDNADIKHFLGKLQISGNHRTQAITLFEQAIQLDPDNRWFYVNKAGAQAENGQLEDALATSATLTWRFVDWSIGYNLKAALLDDLGRVDEALTAYQQAARMHPASAQILTNKGDLHRRLKQLAAARNAYEEALRIQPSYQRAQSALADMAQDNRNP